MLAQASWSLGRVMASRLLETQDLFAKLQVRHLAAPWEALLARLQGASPFFLLCGINVIESEQHTLQVAAQVKRAAQSVGVPLVFKASFDKANRTSLSSFRGPGLDKGLQILGAVKQELNIPILTDVHESTQCPAVAAVADILQIPAFLCRQTDLIRAAAETGRLVHLKKGQFCSASVMVEAAEKVRTAGNPFVMVCERGTSFGYHDLVLDVRNLVLLRAARCPVRAPEAGEGLESGGLRHLIPTVARACVAAGVDGLFLEVHEDPDRAPVDSQTQWPLELLQPLLQELAAVAVATRGRTDVDCGLKKWESRER